MSFKNVIVSSVAAAALATSAFAGTGTITIPNDKTGDYLLFPAYYANSAGWKTDLRVVNTNTSASVVAKVVIRDAKQSNEKVDFLIYLTPGDVWEGLVYEDAGTVHITSSDDSMVIGNVLGSDTTHDLVFPSAVNGQVITSGYVEVFGVAKTTASSTWTDGTNSYTDDLAVAPADKHALYTAFAKDYDVTEWSAVDNDDLTGQAVIYADNTSGQLAMTYPATAFEGVTGTDFPVNQADVDGNYIGVNTVLATMTNVAGAPCSVITGIEAALAKNESYVIHYGDTTIDESALLATFVTKKYRLAEGGSTCNIASIFTPKGTPEYALAQSSDFTVEYASTPRDMEENTPTTPPPGEISGATTETTPPETCDRELCQISVENSVGPEGYVTYTFSGTADDNTTAVNPMPYAAKVMTAKSVGGANVTNIITPAYKIVLP